MLTQASFIILIAEQIYLRDHGMLPTFPEKLVGTVLDRLPGTDGGEMDYGDVPILKIEDPQADLD